MRIITTLKEKGELSSHECCLETTLGSGTLNKQVGGCKALITGAGSFFKRMIKNLKRLKH